MKAETPRERFQREAEESLAGDSTLAERTRENWRPYEQYLKQGPDVGSRKDDADHDAEAKRWRSPGSRS